jgi:hypothetical protein
MIAAIARFGTSTVEAGASGLISKFVVFIVLGAKL